jgi:dephospho-CoA kinase
VKIAAPSVIIVLGPVGAGKSKVCRLLQRELGGKIISIEEFFMRQYGSYDNYSAHKNEAYQKLKTEILSCLNQGANPVIFEEIAISVHGKELVEGFIRDFSTELICVDAELAICKARVSTRGTSKNFSKSDAVVEGAWSAFQQIKASLKFKAKIQNNSLSENELIAEIRKVWP